METTDLVKLQFHEVYFTAEPLQAKVDLIGLFDKSDIICDEGTAKEAFLHLVRTARKHGFRLFFKAPVEFFRSRNGIINDSVAEHLEDGYCTPETHIQYNGLEHLQFSTRKE